MKQKIKRVLLVLCMAVCFLALSACGKKDDVSSEPIPDSVVEMMRSGAEDFLTQFDEVRSDADIDAITKRMEQQEQMVYAAAWKSWKSVNNDLGAMVSVLSDEVTRLDDKTYQIDARVSYEKRELDFVLTVEYAPYGNNPAPIATELSFNPVYTTGEKLAKAGMNTLMGMGTVFVVLIFISFIISRFKNINEWEAKMRAKKEAQEKEKLAELSAAPAPAAAPAPTAVPAPAVAAAPVEPAPVLAEPVLEEENLADDLELVAVITAAIAATASVPAEGLVVRSIRRKSASKWKNA